MGDNARTSLGGIATRSYEMKAYPSIRYVISVTLLACVLAFLHRCHLAQLFESDRHFSHLSTLERELTFRTEMGLYYSYYKTLVESPSMLQGLCLIASDNRSEYPNTINTLKRFNLYPEVVVGFAYRAYMPLMASVGLPTLQCWKVQRGEGQTPIISCEGLGEPAYFYVEAAFLLNGILAGVLFLFGTYLSQSAVGGAVTALCFVYNHGDCTRVQWTPPLRESFAYPFYVLHMFAITAVLRSVHIRTDRSAWKSVTIRCSVAVVAVTTVAFMLPWQFSQFAQATTVACVFAVYALGLIGPRKLRLVICGQALGVLVAFVLLFGNRMIASSYLVAVLASSFMLSYMNFQNRTISSERRSLMFLSVVLTAAFRLTCLVAATVTVKACMGQIVGSEADGHIWELIRSKLTSFRSFDSMLYTCAAEFDWLPMETVVRLCRTLLLPAAAVGLCAAIAAVCVPGSCGEDKRIRSTAVTNSGCPRDNIPENCSEKLTVIERSEGLCVNREQSFAKSSNENFAKHSKSIEQNISDGVELLQRASMDQKLLGSADALISDAAQQVLQQVDNCASRALQWTAVERTAEGAEVVYHALQLCVFGAMAALFMRLKLFLTPHLCLCAALLGSRRLARRWCRGASRRNHWLVLSVVVALMSVEGISNLKSEWRINGEFSAPELEHLMHWIDKHTTPDAVFAGPMPIMAAVKLSTGRPIVNHPHYEDAGLRRRTRLVYTLFSRKAPGDVWTALRTLGVQYAVLEQAWCVGRSREGCAMVDLWDVEDAGNRARPATCEELRRDPTPYFKRVFRNALFDVLLVNDTDLPGGE